MSCKICKNMVISDAVTIVTVDGVDTLVIDIPSQTLANGRRLCLIVAQDVPATATIGMPVAVSIGGDTTTVYPLMSRCCQQATACAIRSRSRYRLVVMTTASGGIFKICGGVGCAPDLRLPAIPAT